MNTPNNTPPINFDYKKSIDGIFHQIKQLDLEEIDIEQFKEQLNNIIEQFKRSDYQNFHDNLEDLSKELMEKQIELGSIIGKKFNEKLVELLRNRNLSDNEKIRKKVDQITIVFGDFIRVMISINSEKLQKKIVRDGSDRVKQAVEKFFNGVYELSQRK